MLSDEERLEEILKTLQDIEEGKGLDLSGTFWRAKYQQDTKFLLQDRLERTKQLLELHNQVKKVLTIVEKQGKTIEEIQQRLGS